MQPKSDGVKPLQTFGWVGDMNFSPPQKWCLKVKQKLMAFLVDSLADVLVALHVELVLCRASFTLQQVAGL